jgi:hypothetical protein
LLLLGVVGCATQLTDEGGDGGGGDGGPGISCAAAGVCPSGSECEFTDGNCKGTTGHCVVMPSNGCPPDIFVPVCACDGQTHATDCFAWLANVAVAHPGVCP